jgi:Do/DeqQ family serine protease
MVRRLVFSMIFVAGGFVAGLVVTGRMRSVEDSLAQQSRPAVSEPPAAQRSSAAAAAVATAGPDFTRVAGAAVKGVANISSMQIVRRSDSPLYSDPLFRYFFGGDADFGSRDRASRSLGSGVVISADGYVVTNNHVIGENNGRDVRTEVTIALPDRREIRGRIIGIDRATDLALLKIEVAGLPVIPWGDSNQLKVGEWVLAIGSPFQLNRTVTAGIVSATGRADLGFTQYEDFIQTDAAINPGNSGGALVNTRGELIGINTGIYSESGGYQGIGFAVPSNLARKVVDDLMKYGEVRRGSIGYLLVEKLTPEMAREFGAPSASGALVARMRQNSEAYHAGIRPGDIVVAFNGQPITEPSQLLRMVADARIGSTATLTILREGRSMQFRLPIVSTSSSSGGRR